MPRGGPGLSRTSAGGGVCGAVPSLGRFHIRDSIVIGSSLLGSTRSIYIYIYIYLSIYIPAYLSIY